MTKTTRRRDTAEFEAAVYVRLGEPGETLSSVDSGSQCRGDAGDRPDDRSSRLLTRWKRLRAIGNAEGPQIRDGMRSSCQHYRAPPEDLVILIPSWLSDHPPPACNRRFRRMPEVSNNPNRVSCRCTACFARPVTHCEAPEPPHG